MPILKDTNYLIFIVSNFLGTAQHASLWRFFIAREQENKSTSVVQHHKEKYGGNFPIWVIVEFFSMGMLSYFYADLQSGDQKYLAKELYGTSVACLKSWLRCIMSCPQKVGHYEN